MRIRAKGLGKRRFHRWAVASGTAILNLWAAPRGAISESSASTYTWNDTTDTWSDTTVPPWSPSEPVSSVENTLVFGAGSSSYTSTFDGATGFQLNQLDLSASNGQFNVLTATTQTNTLDFYSDAEGDSPAINVSGGGTFEIQNNIRVAAGTNLTLDVASGSNLVFSAATTPAGSTGQSISPVSGSTSTITVAGGGTIVWRTISTTYIVVQNGTVLTDADGDFLGNAYVTIGSQGVVNCSGYAEGFDALSGSAGAVFISNGSVSVGVSNDGTYEYDGIIKDYAGQTTVAGFGKVGAASAASGTLDKTSSSTEILTGASTYKGTTTIAGGILEYAGPVSSSTTTGGYPSGTILSSPFGVGTLALSGGTLATDANNRVILNPITVTAGDSSFIAVPAANQLTLVGALGSTGTVTTVGPGTIDLFGPGTASTFSGTLANDGATLKLDYSTNNVAKTGTGATLDVGAGNILVQGNSSNNTTSTFAALGFVGGGQIQVISGGPTAPATLNLGAISRLPGAGAVNFVIADPTSEFITTTTPNPTDVLGGYATFNSTDWAIAVGSANGAPTTGTSPYTIAALPAASYSPSGTSNSAWGAGLHTDVTGSFTVSAGTTADVRFNSGTAGYTVTLTGTNSITDGGILVTPNVGGYASKISGGTITSASDLVVNQFDSAGGLTISSAINNTVGTAVPETVNSIGTGADQQTLTLSAGQTTAGLSVGMLVTSGTVIPASDNAHIIAIPSSTTVTIAYTTAPAGSTSSISVNFTPETNVVKTGTGQLTLSGTNTLAGLIAIDAGTVTVSAAANLGPTTASAANGTSTIYLNGGTLEFSASATYSTANIQPWIIGPAGGDIQVDSSATVVRMGYGLFGSGTLTKTGAGTLGVEYDPAPFAGPIIVNAGIVEVTSDNLSNASGLTVNYDGGAGLTGGQFRILDNGKANWSFGSGSVLSLEGNGPSGSSTPGAMALAVDTEPGPVSTFTNAINLVADSRIGSYALVTGNVFYNSSLILSGAISGAGGLIKDGAGLLTLTNTGNSYQGNTTISDGTLTLGANNAIPMTSMLIFGEAAGSTVPSGSANNSGTLDMNGFNQTVAGIATAGTGTAHQIVNSGATPVTLTVNYSGASPETFAGLIGGGTTINGNPINLSFTGSGTTILTAANLYSGTTSVGSGTLAAGSPHALGDSASVVSVAAGATLDLAGQTPAAGKTITLAGGSLVNNTPGSTAALNTAVSATLLTGGSYAPGATPAIAVGSGTALLTPLLQLANTGVTLNGGSGYSSVPAVSFSTPPAGGAAPTALASLGVTSASFTIPAAVVGTTDAYSAAPTATITGSVGVTATATAILDDNGYVIGVTITNPGTGFTTAPTLKFSNGTIMSGSAVPTATGNATNFQVSTVSIETPGSGYTTAPTLTIAAPGSGVQATATENSVVYGLLVSNGGSGYVSAPSITFSGGGPDATAIGGYASISLTANSNIGGNGNLVVNPAISSTGPFGLAKIGSGVLTLAANNTYSGGTTLQAGTLLANGPSDGATYSATGTGPVSVSAGATLAGTGTVLGTVTVAGGTPVAPATNAGGIIGAGDAGVSKVGQLSLPGGLSLAATPGTTSTYVWGLSDAAAAPGVGYDNLNLGISTLSIGTGSTVDITPIAIGTIANFNPATTYHWSILTTASGQGNLASLAAQFALDQPALSALAYSLGLTSSAGSTSANSDFSITSDSNDIIISYSAAPEPTGFALAGIAAGAMLLRRRRKNLQAS